ncbi:MAG: hypothetical protein GYA39_03685 [Methanothrix sp.]|nr:hypothetical protein [Methanothrix sp.]
MHVKLAAIILCILIQSSYLALAQDVDLTGTWESKYQFGPIEEVMTAKIQQVGANLLGSFSVKPNTGSEYSGIIFGKVEGDKVSANYLSVRNTGDTDPQIVITFTDGRIINPNTLKGTYYVQDSDMNAVSGPYEAHRKH